MSEKSEQESVNGLALGHRAIATKQAEIDYLQANDAVAAALFGSDKAGELVFLDLDDAALAVVAQRLGVEPGQALPAIADRVTPLLELRDPKASIFEHFTRLSTAWYRHTRQNLDDITLLPPPPVIALLALFSTVGRHASKLAATTKNKSSQTFFLPLSVLLQTGADSVKELEAAYKKDTEQYWSTLSYWLGLRDGQVGLPVGDALNQRPLGLALSQTLLGESERAQLHQMFADLGLTTAQGLSPEELGIYLDFWLDVADTDVSAPMRSIWSTSATRYPGLEVARTELAQWERSRAEAGGATPFTRSQGGKTGAHHAALSLVDTQDYIGNPSFEVGFVVPKRFMTGREVELETTEGPRTVFLSYIGDAYLGISGHAARIPSSSLLSGVLELTAGAHRFTRRPRPLVVFAKDAFSDTFISVDHIPAAWPCRVLVKDEEEMIASVRAILDDSASPDYSFVPAGTSGLPQGWAMFDNVQVLRAGNPELTVDDTYSGLVARLVPTVRLSGGLRIPGDVVRWSALLPPQITVVSDTDAPLSLEVEWRSPETFRLNRHKLAESVKPPFQISVARTPMVRSDGALQPNDYTLILKSGRTVKQRLQYSVRDSSFRAAQRADSYAGEYLHTSDHALWPVTASLEEEVPEAYAQGAFDNLEAFELSPQALEEHPVPRVPGWRAAEQQLEVERVNVLPEQAGPSCLAKGKHRVVLPPMDPKSKAKWIFGRCRDCGLQKRFPGRLTDLAAISEVGSKDSLQFIGPEEREYATSWAAVRDALTFLGRGKRSSLSILARQLEDTERFEQWFVHHLQALGFLETLRDQHWTVRRWQVCSPALTQLVDGSILLTGGWTRALEEQVASVAEELGGSFVTLSPEDHGMSLIQDLELEELHEALPEGPWDVIYEAGPTMLDTLPSLGQVQDELPRVEMQYNGVAERFEAADATWHPTTDRERAGLYRVNHHHRTRYLFRTPADVSSGHARSVDSGLGKHLAARQEGTPLVSWDPELELLSVPIGAELPGLYARATVLCSGVLPSRVDEDFSLNYGEIGETFAQVLTAKLMS